MNSNESERLSSLCHFHGIFLFLLRKQEYIRLIDKMTGEERVVRGPTEGGGLVPKPLEESPAGVETAIVIGAQNAVLVGHFTSFTFTSFTFIYFHLLSFTLFQVYNKTSGLKALITTARAP